MSTLQKITLDDKVYVLESSIPSTTETKVLELDGTECPYVIGQNYLIETCTKYFTGKLERVTDKELVISNAAWVADTGKYSTALATGDFSEVEMMPMECRPIISRGAIVTVIPVSFTLPSTTK